MTEAQEKILLHTLGLDRSPTSYRNFYLTGRGCTDFHAVQDLVAKGFLSRGRKAVSYEGIQEMHYYSVTEAGKAEAARIKSIQRSRPTA